MKAKHLYTLNGRVFLLASPAAVENWDGDDDSKDNGNDYELLSNLVSYEEGYLTFYQNDRGLFYYIYFSMSSKVELFSIDNGFIICDGPYFNESWDYSLTSYFKLIESVDFRCNITENGLFVFDAALSGKTVLSYDLKQVESKDWIKIDLGNGLYTINRVETTVLINEENVRLMGVMLTL